MSRIDDVIQRLSRDGVEFYPLGELVEIKNGKDYRAFDTGAIPVYGSGGVMAHIDRSAHPGPSVLIPRKGSLANIYFVDEPFWTGDTIFYTDIRMDRILPKFLYHVLVNMRLEGLNQAGGVPSLTQAILKPLRIPVPALETQREIVSVLDLFQRLEAELEAELEARRRQYAHYRDRLIGSASDLAPRRALGDLGELVRGNGMPKSDFSDSGVGCIHYGQIYTYYGTWTAETISSVPLEKAERLTQVDHGDVLITNTSESVEDVCKAVAWLGLDDIVTGGHATVLKHQQNPKFLAYYFQTAEFHQAKRRYVTGTKVMDVSTKNLAKIEIPIPPLAEQERVVEILDSFDALLNDLSVGLPAELVARRKQYEYYRDRLLTFEEAV